MEDRIKQIFLISFCLFALLVWYNLNQPNFYSSQDHKDYEDYIRQKVHRIVDPKHAKKESSKILLNSRTFASEHGNCLGCCKKQGGVICHGGKTICGSGSHLNFTCQNKGCNACPVLKTKKP